VILCGAADAYGFDDRELALVSASHNGEADHVAAARSILAKSGVPEDALQCGGHVPYDRHAAEALRARGESPTAIYSNCSGKHAGILAMAKFSGAPLSTYLEAAHPAQRAILELCSRLFGLDPGAIPLAIDGCGIPTLAVPLAAAAAGFARFATLAGLDRRDAAALARVKEAMKREPWYVGGSGRFDSLLMAAAAGSIACKGGAEGVFCAALERKGSGLALKVIDGGSRAVSPAAASLLRALDEWPEASQAALKSFERPVLRNVAGAAVGEIVAAAPPSALWRS
jgi:L-asparaginase II